nr:L,D-transpeptidase [Cohaesibacter celericrescens]
MTLLGNSASKDTSIPEAPVVARIDISEQRMNVYVNGLITHSWKVSTGGRGYYTPRGQYAPYRMHTMWRSRKYNNAPMPHSVFFHKGWAIHGTNAISRLGRPASHGCVRLHPKNAKILFNLIKRSGGMKAASVVISN